MTLRRVDPIRCVVVDDNAQFIASVVNLLEREGITIVGSATNCADAVRIVDELSPDVALVDVDLGMESGFDVAERIHQRDDSSAPQTRVILISADSGREFVERLAASPAVGFIPKISLSVRSIREMLSQA